MPHLLSRTLTVTVTGCLSLLLLGAPSASAVTAAPPGSGALTQQLQHWAAGRMSTMSVLVRDERSGRSWSFRPSAAYDNASIVKLNILQTVLYQAQQKHRGLTTWEQQQAVPMIRVSDNDAATALWNHVGGARGVAAYDRVLGLTATTFDSQGHWGLTRSTVTDQVRLVRAVGHGPGPLSTSARSYVRTQMAHVRSDQHWGVSAGPTPRDTVELKNGWLPLRTHGWRVNSIGHITSNGRDYTLAILTQDNPTMTYGIATIEGASRIVFRALAP